MGFIFTLLLFCISVYGYTKLEKMSINQATETLELMDKIVTSNDTADITKFKELTDCDYNESLRHDLYEIIHKNVNHTSFFAKMMGLVTIKNVIILCMIAVAVAFVFSLAHDILLALGAYITMLIVQILLNKKMMYAKGLLFSSIVMYFKPDQIENVYLKYLFIFDWLTPLFGCIIFGIISFKIYDDLIRDDEGNNHKDGEYKHKHGGYNEKNSYVLPGLFVTIVYSIMTVYHQNWLIGVMSVMMLFFTCGFLFGSMFGGYYIGFDNDEAIGRCFLISLILNALMIGIKAGFIIGGVTEYINVFETGVYFWGSLIGCLAMLILSDKTHMVHKKNYTVESLLVRQIVMGVYCLALMYFGSQLDISSYKNIGGTFLVLWVLNLERVFVQALKMHITLVLGITLANLWFIKQLISWYPEYCIFGSTFS